jgi:hypothetical protein
VDLTLIAVAAVAGLATFLSPCVLPVLPVVAATSTTGGRRRPLGIAAGLAVAFVVFTLLASRVLSALGLPQDLLRNIAIGLHAPRLRARPGLHRDHEVDQHARLAPADAARAARQGRPGRLLDVLLRQLHPHAALPEGVVRPLPP